MIAEAAHRQGDIDTPYLEAGRKAAQKWMGENSFDAFEHPVDPSDIEEWVKQTYIHQGTRLHYYYAQLMVSFLWNFGVHHYKVSPRTWQLEYIQRDDRILRPYVNLIGPEVETIVGKILKATPKGRFYPSSNDQMDRLGAEKGNSFFAFKDERDKINEKHRLAAEIGCIAGDAYAYVCRDAADAEIARVPLTAQIEIDGQVMQVPIQGPDGQPAFKEVPLADERTEILLPLQVITARNAYHTDRARWKMIHTFTDHEWAKGAYHGIADEMEAVSTPPTAGVFQWRLQDLVQELGYTGYSPIFGASTQGGYGNREQAVMAVTVLFRPDRFYTKGRKFTCIGGKCVYAGPIPKGEHLLHYRYKPITGSQQSVGMVKDLIGLNRHVEGELYQIAVTRRAIVPYWLVPENSGANWEGGDIAMEPGKLLTYTPVDRNLKPELVQAQGGLEGHLAAELQLFLNEFFGHVSGSKGPMAGENPPGVYAGVALRQLIAQASDRLAPKIKSFYDFIESLYSARAEAVANAPRWQIADDINFPANMGRRGFMMFSAGDLRENFRFKIDAEPESVLDQVTKVQVGMDLWDRGIINGQSPLVRHNMLRMAGVPELGDDGSIHIQKAQKEDALAKAGYPIMVDPRDDHGAHHMQHLYTRMSDEFETWPEEAKQALIEHDEEHVEIMEAQEVAQTTRMRDLGVEPGEEQKFGPPPYPNFGAALPPQVALGMQLPPGGRGQGGGRPR